MKPKSTNDGDLRTSAGAPVRRAIRRCGGILAGVCVFSFAINVLGLVGSLYMLQVYDRVLPSRSVPTLVALTVLMVGLYIAYGLLDFIRSRIMLRIGLKVEAKVRDQVFGLVQSLPLRARQEADALQPIRDLDTIRSFLAGPGPTAIIDMPWMPLYLGLVFCLHPFLGLLGLLGGVLLVLITLAAERNARRQNVESLKRGAERHLFSDAARRNAEAVQAMGFAPHVQQHWAHLNAVYLRAQARSSEGYLPLQVISKVLRPLLQSAILGLGAWLVIRNEASGGVMIAASILTSRALTPVEVAIANWKQFVGARHAIHRLDKLLGALPPQSVLMKLPRASNSLSVRNIWVAPPGSTTPIIRDLSFTLEAGAGLGILGASASGKSTLARAIVGAWNVMPNRGLIELDGASLDQWDPSVLGANIGYLPQELLLFDGTVMQNISRFEPNPESENVISAAKAAGAHEMITKLPKGYNTSIGEGGSILSVGQRQRIALARALYKDPFLVVLDEPNSNLDGAGDLALDKAIRTVRARGGIVIVIAHRPAGLDALDTLLVLHEGQIRSFGKKEDVLRGPATAVAQLAKAGPVLKSIVEAH